MNAVSGRAGKAWWATVLVKQRTVANGTTLGEAFEIPRDHVGYFEFDVPKTVLQEGS